MTFTTKVIIFVSIVAVVALISIIRDRRMK
jgi:hypothetical protein